MSYDNYFKRIEIAKLPTVALRRAALKEAGLTNMCPTIADEGFYRKPITKRLPNGKVRILDYIPVALWQIDGELEGAVGAGDQAHDATPNEIVDLWTWISTYPIYEQQYRAVAERGERWPDCDVEVPIEEVDDSAGADPVRTITSTDNNPPEALPPHIQHTEAIQSAIGAAQDLKATDEASAAIVLGAKNRLAELRLKADKAGHAIYDPLREKYLAEQKRWAPIVAHADAMEKELNRRYLIWRSEENRKIAAAAAEAAAAKAEADRQQQELDEANERAAQRAIAQGLPEPSPEAPVEAPPANPPPAPTPVEPTYRASGQRSRPKEVESWHIDDITDFDALYNYFKDVPAVQATLKTLATAAVKAGRDVPGLTKHWGLL